MKAYTTKQAEERFTCKECKKRPAMWERVESHLNATAPELIEDFKSLAYRDSGCDCVIDRTVSIRCPSCAERVWFDWSQIPNEFDCPYCAKHLKDEKPGYRKYRVV